MNRNLAAPLLLVGTNLLATALVAATAFLAAPAFASGYGPAPSYSPTHSAPDSERGQSALTLAAQSQTTDDTADTHGNVPLSRAEVRAELGQLEKAGYNPARGRDPDYPADIQAAEARVAAQNAQAATAQVHVGDSSGVGGVVTGVSASGAPAIAVVTGSGSLYSRH
ncbi:DUF4148 domain-containing protein [Caballeronia sp. LjRoot34]|uniref:DUF4148 domain-containing protein n=1 Tax=Caballeronia sp. LjRoot34 TaxID=3342325 RepID=UPI003ECDD21E